MDVIDNESLLKAILDGSNQMVQVSDAETYEMLYANKTALRFAGKEDIPYKGQPCFAYMMGLEAPCPYCPLKDIHGSETCEAEVDNGEQVFAVKTQYLTRNGRKAFIEYAWDITRERRSLKIFEAQKRTLMQSLTHAQGIFHIDVTDNKCMSVGGVSKNAQDFTENQTIDVMNAIAAKYIPTPPKKRTTSAPSAATHC